MATTNTVKVAYKKPKKTAVKKSSNSTNCTDRIQATKKSKPDAKKKKYGI